MDFSVQMKGLRDDEKKTLFQWYEVENELYLGGFLRSLFWTRIPWPEGEKGQEFSCEVSFLAARAEATRCGGHCRWSRKIDYRLLSRVYSRQWHKYILFI